MGYIIYFEDLIEDIRTDEDERKAEPSERKLTYLKYIISSHSTYVGCDQILLRICPGSLAELDV